MLGWEIVISEKPPDDLELIKSKDLIVRWTTGVMGARWLDEMVISNDALDLGGNGYPNLYSATVKAVLAKVSGNPVNWNDREIIGDDYVLGKGLIGGQAIDLSVLTPYSADQALLIEVWDQS